MKDAALLIPVKFSLCLDRLRSLVGGLARGRGCSLPTFSRNLLKPSSWSVNSHPYPCRASLQWGRDLPRLLLPGVDSWDVKHWRAMWIYWLFCWVARQGYRRLPVSLIGAALSQGTCVSKSWSRQKKKEKKKNNKKKQWRKKMHRDNLGSRVGQALGRQGCGEGCQGARRRRGGRESPQSSGWRCAGRTGVDWASMEDCTELTLNLTYINFGAVAFTISVVLWV